MKTLLSLILFSVLALPAFGQSKAINTFTAKAVDSSSSRSDTSITVTVGAYPNIDILTTATNTDSVKMTVYVDVLLNGAWYNSVANGVFTTGHPSLHTPGLATGQNSDLILRDNARIADLLQAGGQIRIRNVITGAGVYPYKNQSYTQNVILRKVTW
jgi:hypothetical protein